MAPEKEEPLKNVKEEVQSDDVTVNKETDTLNELNTQIEQILYIVKTQVIQKRLRIYIYIKIRLLILKLMKDHPGHLL